MPPINMAGLSATKIRWDKLAPPHLAKYVVPALIKNKATNQDGWIRTVPYLKLNQTKGCGPNFPSMPRAITATMAPAMIKFRVPTYLSIFMRPIVLQRWTHCLAPNNAVFGDVGPGTQLSGNATPRFHVTATGLVFRQGSSPLRRVLSPISSLRSPNPTSMRWQGRLRSLQTGRISCRLTYQRQNPIKAWEWRAPLQSGMPPSPKNRLKTLKHWPGERLNRFHRSRVLEVAPGPGYFAIELAKLGNYQITGLDISKTFVGMARASAAKAGVRVDFRRGNASNMPFGNESFDFLLCRAAFKNFSEPHCALEEIHRVLKPGGQALIIDLRRDTSKESINQAVNDMNLGTVNGILTKLAFRFSCSNALIQRMNLNR